MILNEEWCRFFREERFFVGLSLDAFRSVHDIYRVDAEGSAPLPVKAAEETETYTVTFERMLDKSLQNLGMD